MFQPKERLPGARDSILCECTRGALAHPADAEDMQLIGCVCELTVGDVLNVRLCVFLETRA